MFGLNDNDSQKTDTKDGSGATDASVVSQDNPFGDSEAPRPNDAPTSSSTAPALHDEPASSDSSPAKTTPDDNLLDLKHRALQSLQPLVSHLDQSPEEKFKTTMMLIQATDDSSLVNQAYEAANQIEDEKARAQALLDVVNEINYFTQNSGGKKV